MEVGNIVGRYAVGIVMHRIIWPMGLLFALIVAACGGGAEEGTSAAAPAVPQTTSTLATDKQLQRVGDDILVPDFTVALGDGEVFDSASVDTPLYIVFWAEW